MGVHPRPADLGSEPRHYASPSILARRRRILAATRHVLAEHGVEGTGMMAVATAAEVSRRQLYNLYETRETLIIAAIEERFGELLAEQPLRARRGSFGRIVERIALWTSGSAELRRYVKASAVLIASDDAVPPESIQRHALDPYAEWLAAMAARGHLSPWVKVEDAARMLVDYEFGTLNSWACGRIEDAQIGGIVMEGLLLLARGVTSSSAHSGLSRAARRLRE